MKSIFAGIFAISATAISVGGQTLPVAGLAPARAFVDVTTSSDKIVKGSPFSADAVSESVQVLADGNRIVRNTTSRLHRNGEGRFRREMTNGSGGLLGSVYSFGSGVTILDPVVGFRYQLDPTARTAVQGVLRERLSPKQAEDLALSTAQSSNVTMVRRPAELQRVETEIRTMAPLPLTAATGARIAPAIEGFMPSVVGHSKYESRVEQLGSQNIEGVQADGTRTTTTIPAGAIGNERPIDVVYERWYSNDLQLVVMSKNYDPRSGEQTYRLTNIVRSEPDPSLFTLPNGYRIVSDRGSTPFQHETRVKVEAEKAGGAKGGTNIYVRTKP